MIKVPLEDVALSQMANILKKFYTVEANSKGMLNNFITETLNIKWWSCLNSNSYFFVDQGQRQMVLHSYSNFHSAPYHPNNILWHSKNHYLGKHSKPQWLIFDLVLKMTYNAVIMKSVNHKGEWSTTYFK